MSKRIFLYIYDDRFEFGDLIVTKEEFETYYLVHRKTECSKYFGLCVSNIQKISSTWNIHKTKETLQALSCETKLERYGDANYNNPEKGKQTLINKYGSLEKAYEENTKLCKQTKLERYGDPNYNNSEKNAQTCLEKYGVDNVFKSEEIKNKIRNTSQTKYGVSWTSQSEPTLRHCKETCLEKFGVSSYLGSDADLKYRKEHKNEYNESRAETLRKNLEINPNYLKDIAKKVCASKRQNGTFNTSESEEILYKSLCIKYGKDNVIRQYYDKNRYPYRCDFYIKSKDLYIELNAHWTHGAHPFDSKNEDDIKKLQEIKSKQGFRENNKKNMFYCAEYVWTILDTQKQKCARDNNLNYLMIYKDGVYDKQKKLEKDDEILQGVCWSK